MAKFSAEVTGYTHRSGDYFTQTLDKTLGGIVVRPPITSGENFKSAVLGQDGHGVELSEVASTTEASVFIAKSSRGTEESQKTDIVKIAERIAELVNNPDSVIRLIDENPFPAPQERW